MTTKVFEHYCYSPGDSSKTPTRRLTFILVLHFYSDRRILEGHDGSYKWLDLWHHEGHDRSDKWLDV